MMRRWRDWAYIYERENKIEIGHRDFGREDEMMSQKDFLETLHCQTFSEADNDEDE